MCLVLLLREVIQKNAIFSTDISIVKPYRGQIPFFDDENREGAC